MPTNALILQAVQPKAGTPGVASEGAPAGSAPAAPGGGLLVMLPLLMIVPILFMSFRRQKKESAQRASLKKGDKILTNSGIVGELIEMDEKLAKVKIAPGTTITVVSSMVSPYDIAPVTAAVDVKDAKALAEKK